MIILTTSHFTSYIYVDGRGWLDIRQDLWAKGLQAAERVNRNNPIRNLSLTVLRRTADGKALEEWAQETPLHAPIPYQRHLKTHLKFVKCSSSLEWERQDPWVTKEVLQARWMFAERSQVVIIERKLHSRFDRYRLMILFRALQHDLTPPLRPWRYMWNTFPKFNYKRSSYRTRQARGTSNKIIHCLAQRINEKIFPSLLNSSPIRPILPRYNNDFGSRQAYHKPSKLAESLT